MIVVIIVRRYLEKIDDIRMEEEIVRFEEFNNGFNPLKGFSCSVARVLASIFHFHQTNRQ